LHCSLPQLPLPQSLHVSIAVLPHTAHNPAMFMAVTSALIFKNLVAAAFERMKKNAEKA